MFGLSFLISSYAPEVNHDILNTPVESQNQSIELLPEKTEVPKTEIAEITETAKISTPVRATGGSKTQSYTITQIANTLVPEPSYKDIYRTGKLVYAHNSNNLFGALKNLGIGSTVNLTEGGTTTSYRVSGIGHFTKVPYKNGENLVECYAGYSNCGSDVQMGMLVNYAKGHKLAMMTCDGERGTPNRLIIYLD